MKRPIRRCIYCSSASITAATTGRFEFIVCHGCEAAFAVEFQPPDDPFTVARITPLADTPPRRQPGRKRVTQPPSSKFVM
jgi:hypothetical protein